MAEAILCRGRMEYEKVILAWTKLSYIIEQDTKFMRRNDVGNYQLP